MLRKIPSLFSKEGLDCIQNARAAIKRKGKRDAAKLKAANSVLKRKVIKKVSRIIKEQPTIGSDIEEFEGGS